MHAFTSFALEHDLVDLVNNLYVVKKHFMLRQFMKQDIVRSYQVMDLLSPYFQYVEVNANNLTM